MATAPPTANAVLVRRLRERDRSAWEELYAEYGPRLRPFAYRLTGNVHDADDLVQETFVRALPRLDRLDPETVELGPYLFTTLRNLFLKSVERGRRAQTVADVPEPTTPAPIEDDPERSTLLHRQQEEVRVANARLAPRQRLVLALRELEDRSYAEIGVIVGLNENAVAQLISRARESLRTELRLAQVDPASLPEECRRFLPLLSRHLDGQLRGTPLQQTLEHLEGCDRCQNALSSMREAQRRYRTLLPLFLGGDEERDKIDAELAAAGYWSGPRGRLRFGRPGMVIAASVALLAAGGGGVGAAVLMTKNGSAAAPPTTSGEATTATRVTDTAGSTRAKKRTRPAKTEAVVTIGVSTLTDATPTTAPGSTAQTTSPPVKPRTTAEIDRSAPTVTILTRPQAQTSSRDASFSFRASEPGSSFACRLDNTAFAACSSSVTYRKLTLGGHSFAVRARDKAGNTGTAVLFRWTVMPPPDTTPPTVRIDSAAVSGGEATFQFTSSEPGSTFACSLDGTAFVPCTSPRGYSGLAPGAHTFAVRATDAAGNTGAAATHSWTVPQPLPDLLISALTETSFTVTNSGTAPAGAFVVSVTLIGTFSFPGLAPGQSATRMWSVCRVGTLTVIADRGRTVTESNENNNTRALVSDC